MRKHRLTVLCVSALGALGVISSGFAGWVITMGPKEASGTGSITADGDITQQGVKSCVVDNAAKTIRFAANGTSVSGGWLTASKNDANMSATFTFTITTTEANMTVNFTELKFEEKDGDKYATAYNQGEGLVGSLPAFGATGTTEQGVGTIVLTGATLDSGNKTATAMATTTTLDVTFTVTFAWGKKFNYKNPFDYYNASPYTSELDSEANKNIKALDGLNGATFALSFKVSATPATPNA
jgi:hypothetical protein